MLPVLLDCYERLEYLVFQVDPDRALKDYSQALALLAEGKHWPRPLIRENYQQLKTLYPI
ncbi:hypothetical protein MASR1M31_23850 [Porphyromonadaceae bacterium]|jgi:hypothetical protein